MSKPKGYSPRLEPDLIPVLYRERKRRHIPMTKLPATAEPQQRRS